MVNALVEVKSKGMALVDAREMFGPRGFVRRLKDTPKSCAVGIFDERGWIPLASAETWELALAYADDARVLRQGM